MIKSQYRTYFKNASHLQPRTMGGFKFWVEYGVFVGIILNVGVRAGVGVVLVLVLVIIIEH